MPVQLGATRQDGLELRQLSARSYIAGGESGLPGFTAPRTTMWSELCADARMYCALRWPAGAGMWRRGLIWVSSRGLLVLAVQRLSHYYLTRRERDGWTLQTLTLRVALALGPRILVVFTKSDVASRAIFEPGIYLSDRGYLILGPRRVGSGTLIHERVTIGPTAGGAVGPTIGQNVWIGPDCVIYGENCTRRRCNRTTWHRALDERVGWDCRRRQSRNRSAAGFRQCCAATLAGARHR